MLGGELEIDEISPVAEVGAKPNPERKKKSKIKKEKRLIEEHDEKGDEENQKSSDGDEQEAQQDEVKQGGDREKKEGKRNRKKERLMKKAAEADNRGVCYLSRIPPHMDPRTLRKILSQYGEIGRVYLLPSGGAAAGGNAKKTSSRRTHDQAYSEGWVEFARKGVAKRVANMLNGEQVGGRKRSSFYYDLWNIKYLSKFKWDDLTGETAYKSAIREQKLALEIAAAKRERDFYLNRVDQSRAQTAIEERLKKKQKIKQGSEAELPITQPKMIREFPQNKPVAAGTIESKPKLSQDFFAGVFGSA